MPRTSTYMGVRLGASVYERRKGTPSEIKVGTVTNCEITGQRKLSYRTIYSAASTVREIASALELGKLTYVREHLPGYTAQDPAVVQGLAEEIDRIIEAAVPITVAWRALL